MTANPINPDWREKAVERMFAEGKTMFVPYEVQRRICSIVDHLPDCDWNDPEDSCADMICGHVRFLAEWLRRVGLCERSK